MSLAVLKRFAVAALLTASAMGAVAQAQVHVLRVPAATVLGSDTKPSGVLRFATLQAEFSDVPAGSLGMRSILVENPGTEPVRLNGSGSFGDAFFGMTECAGSDGLIPPGGQCLAWVVFTPQGSSPSTGRVAFHDSNGGRYDIAVSGTVDSPIITLSKGMMTLEQVDGVEATDTFSIRNESASTVPVAVGMRGSSNGFTFAPSGCMLPPGGQCTVSVTYNLPGFNSDAMLLMNYGPGYSHASVLQIRARGGAW